MGTRVVHRGIACLAMDRRWAELARQVIQCYPAHLRARVNAAGIRTVLVGVFERYAHYSAVLARTDVDQEKVPPLGIFVPEERALYVRLPRPMVVAHEYGHAIDFALGEGMRPFSACNSAIRRAYRAALRRMAFITPGAASGVEEYVAEAMRAMVGVYDEDHRWPPVSPERLQEVDPALYAVMERIWRPPPG